MAVGISSAIADSILNAYCRNVAWTQPAAFWVKLHIGDPGAAGTANAAGNTTRQQATFSASSGGVITTSAAIVWTSVSTTETYSHVSFWTASTAGTFIGSDNLEVARSVTATDTFTIATGDIDITLGAIAA